MDKIILVDDHSLFREGMKLLIETEGLGEVVAEAENGKAFLELLEVHKPDLVIMDLEMPIMRGSEATQKAKEICPDIKILVLTMLNEDANYLEMLNAGAMGFVLKTAGKNELEKAIKAVIGNESFFSNELLCRIIINQNAKYKQNPERLANTDLKLTDNELEVLRYFCQGLTVTEIAAEIFRTVKTVEARRSNLLKKTNTKNTINLILYAVKNRLVEI